MIKRCPFCGSKVKITKVKEKWKISCSNEECQCSFPAGYNSRSEAIEAWNKRTSVSYNLNPETVINYLEENGWVKTDAAAYVAEDGSETVRVPLDADAPRFEENMKEVVEIISNYELETPEDIIEYMGDEFVYCTRCGYYRDHKCLCEGTCYFNDPEDAAPRSLRTEYLEPELGNILFGNSRGEYAVNRDLIEPVFWKYFENSFDTYMYFQSESSPYITDRGGFENEVFRVNPYYWGDDDEIAEEPNFIYKPENVEISWYKYPFRDSYSSINLTTEKAEEIFSKCRASMGETL